MINLGVHQVGQTVLAPEESENSNVESSSIEMNTIPMSVHQSAENKDNSSPDDIKTLHEEVSDYITVENFGIVPSTKSDISGNEQRALEIAECIDVGSLWENSEESQINHYPINHEDDQVLTPVRVTDAPYYPELKFTRKQLRIAQNLSQHFEKRWVQERIPNLNLRGKRTQLAGPLKMNDIIILSDENQPRDAWNESRIIAVKTAADKQIRTGTVKTTQGTNHQPANRIVKPDVSRDVQNEVPNEGELSLQFTEIRLMNHHIEKIKKADQRRRRHHPRGHPQKGPGPANTAGRYSRRRIKIPDDHFTDLYISPTYDDHGNHRLELLPTVPKDDRSRSRQPKRCRHSRQPRRRRHSHQPSRRRHSRQPSRRRHIR